ncbi:MAG: restriction endonuclease subunit S, partial [Confluentibacter sp.]|nr:restriction endonuclease subunit S [Confluentibacter sp.]
MKNNNPRFLQPYFSSNKGQNTFKSLQTGSGREGLNFESIKNQKIFVPVFSEQTKIADFLALLDLRINTQNEIIGEYELLQKGLARQLFEKGLKFNNDGNNFLSWKLVKLHEMATITTGSSNREDSILDGKYTFFDRSQDIRSSNQYLFDKEAIIVPGEGQEFIPKYFVGKFD